MEPEAPTIAIMRPEGYLPASRELAESMGFNVIEAPMIELKAIRDEMFDIVIEHILSGKSDYVIFTSANGIEHTLGKLDTQNQKKLVNKLNQTNVVAIGPTTKKRLLDIGVEVMGMPGVYSSEGLVKYLCPMVKGKTVDVARSAYGSTYLISGLKKCDAIIYETQVYTLVRPEGEKQKNLMEKALDGKISVFAFTSSMMVRNFFELAQSMGKLEAVTDILNTSIVSAIGGPTASTLGEYGIKTAIQPGKYTFEEMLSTIKKECF
ncbi:uroporphyrinogen-III synthase [Methanohalophilus sp.]|uniref:uroporphyrinogen-III synthase n=1 Tax=Methanohalophilus sp. TaxID=1966352 RepID=UPI0026133CC1|nr:uroporphyrinogen-III synthase [Methanohalophilus sp.]MDK2892115.1 uroporphyrinogen-III synthase [Methanohalophilus sp.]